MDDQTRLHYLSLIGVQSWQIRKQSIAAIQSANSDVATQLASVNWDELQSQVRHCSACDLHRSRTQAVFGVGDAQADLVIIGEAPGAEEDRQGEPFVGRAGILLNEMLRAVGLTREAVFIANMLKCRPPNNRDPSP